ncbi:MAG: competence/damage-inducible protein A [Legionellales bacterium]|nr:competence/damage-inducible protein A [Legionellales bacterium]
MKIALLATGTELVTGDILNTNGQHIAQLLTDEGYTIGQHILVSDEQTDIISALNYLMQTHQIIIIIGGLGPTTDDRTRFAVSEVIGQELVFHEPSWKDIVDRLTHYGLVVSENNRQQALFPDSATIFQNQNGTANACKIVSGENLLYLLPGPPNECLPLFDNQIFPDIQHLSPPQKQYKRKWRLFGVSESAISAELEAVLSDTTVTTGYRVDYPYLEFKISANHPPAPNEWLEKLEAIIQPHLLADAYEPASTLLKKKLARLSHPLLLIDSATGGYLYQTISNRDNYHQLVYTQRLGLDEENFLAVIEIHGLLEHWAGLDHTLKTQVEIQLRSKQQNEKVIIEIPYRPQRVLRYATEIIAKQILEWLDEE